MSTSRILSGIVRAPFRRPADVRGAGGVRRGSGAAAGDRAHCPGPVGRRSSTTTSFVRTGAAQRVRTSSGCCSTRAIVSGVGNIYADEGLWIARVHGERPGSSGCAGPTSSGCWPAAAQVKLAALGQFSGQISGYGLVRLGALAAVIAFLDVFLGVVPGAAARRHRDRDEQPGHDRAEQHRAERAERRRPGRPSADDDIEHDRRQHRQQRRHDHLADRRLVSMSTARP